MKRLVLATVLLTCTLVGAGTASAAPLTLNCPTGFTTHPISFGGTDIPNDAICFGSFQGVNLALTAHQRYDNPALTNDGNNTFFAGTGDDTANGESGFAIWNFGFYAYNSTETDFFVDLRWETNPGAATDEALAGHASGVLEAGEFVQNSWNLGMGFIDTVSGFPGISPASGLFSPYASGQYSFDLRVFREQTLFGAVGINVVTGTPVPEPASFLLLGAGLAGVAFRLRRRRKA